MFSMIQFNFLLHVTSTAKERKIVVVDSDSPDKFRHDYQ